MVSTVASGDVKPYVGPSDICMMYSVTDISGINRISEKVLANAAHALAGMIAFSRSPAPAEAQSKPALGLTMFGLTTPCVQAVCKQLEARVRLPRVPRHRHRRPERWRSSPTRACSPACSTSPPPRSPTRSWAACSPPARRGWTFSRRPTIPYVGSCGALDMVNFWARPTVPARFKDRTLHVHNPNVTLMRTTPEEAARIGRFIVDKLNRMEGPVRFLIPEGGLSGLDRPGGPFWDPAADKALFDVIASNFRAGDEPEAAPAPAPHQRPGVRRRAGRQLQRDQDPMARIARQDILKTLRGDGAPRRADHRRRRRHRPVRQVRGGRRHRPHRHLQLRPLPHGRARLARRPDGLRQRQRDRARDGARGAAGGQAHAGAGRGQRHRSVPPGRSLLEDPRRRWASRASRTSRRSGCSTA